jgi:hypothetical protein
MNHPEEKIPPDIRSTLDAMNRRKFINRGAILRGSLFVAVVLLTVIVTFPLYGGYLIGTAMSAGSGGGHSVLAFIPVVDFLIITSSAVVVF